MNFYNNLNFNKIANFASLLANDEEMAKELRFSSDKLKIFSQKVYILQIYY